MDRFNRSDRYNGSYRLDRNDWANGSNGSNWFYWCNWTYRMDR
jgi:hypothetical protein